MDYRLLCALGLALGASACSPGLSSLEKEMLAKTGGTASGNPIRPDSDFLVQSQAMLQGRAFTTSGGRQVSPADFQSMDLSLSFDVASQTATGHAEIRFAATTDGYAYFRMTPDADQIRLDGQTVSILDTEDPSGATSFRVIDSELKAGQSHTLTIDYAVPSSEVTFQNGGVAIVTSMADITDGNFFESYGPANIEADQFKMKLALSIQGAGATHRLFTNGAATQIDGSNWTVEFPDYFNSSGLYFHLTNTSMAVRETTYIGLEKAIPITIYSQSSANADAAFSAINGLFRELEDTYGPYLHDRFVAYISGSGGMEHSGATITSNSALGHELTHSWFARGVMPADGRSGWVDEAIASWRDNGYPRSSSLDTRSSTNLANFSQYAVFTPYNAYADGRALLAELDGRFASKFGGLRPVLKKFFSYWKSNVISTELFHLFLETETGIDLDSTFLKYVYGNRSMSFALQGGDASPQATNAIPDSSQASDEDRDHHPPALTRGEVLDLR